MGTVWAYRMRQAQTVPKPFRAKRCKVRDVKRCGSPVRQGLYWTPLLRAQPSGAALKGGRLNAEKTALTNRKATLLVIASLCPSENILENGIVRWLFRQRGEGKSFEIDQQCRRERRLEPSGKGLMVAFDRTAKPPAIDPCARGHPSSMASHDYILVFSGLPCDLGRLHELFF